MHFKSRILATAAVIVMAAAAVFGSTFELKTGEDAAEDFSLFGKKETIYVWYGDEALSNYVNSAAVAFGEKEGVRVIPILSNESEYLEAINRDSLHSEQMPDAYIISNESLEKACMAGLAVEILDEQGICTEENFSQTALDAVSYHGKKVAYPLYFETSALIYNKTYLEEWARQQAEKELANEGSEIDTATGEPAGGADLDEAVLEQKKQEYFAQAVPDTVDDILHFADTFDVPNGVEGIMNWDVSDIFYNYWIVGEYMIIGGDAGDDEADMNINNAETIQCLEVYKALNQFFSIESDKVDYDSVVQEFMEGKIVFTVATSDVLKSLADAKDAGELTFEYGVTCMPDISDELESRSMSVTGTIAVNGFSEHRELADRFAAYLAGNCYEDVYERTGKLSACAKASAKDEYAQAFSEEYADSVSLPKMMKTENFWVQLEILFAKVWNGEDVTALVQELADNMAAQMGPL